MELFGLFGAGNPGLVGAAGLSNPRPTPPTDLLLVVLVVVLEVEATFRGDKDFGGSSATLCGDGGGDALLRSIKPAGPETCRVKLGA